MSHASSRTEAGSESWIDRWRAWLAALSSALLHLLALLVALLSPTPVMTPPESAASGSWVQVDFIGETSDDEQPVPSPPPPARPERPPPAASRLQTTPVPLADDPLPPDIAAPPATAAVPRPATAPRSADANPQRQSQRPAASPAPTTRRRPEAWGQPPGLVVQDLAPQRPGPARGPARQRGQGSADSASLELGGYHVYYDLSSETRLRAWQEEGMTEIFIPLPGTRQLMVCPLEVALHRDSGKCRPLPPDSPELTTIGDARDVIGVQQVYRRGELLWRGPGPYR